jgi:hypothetical protein
MRAGDRRAVFCTVVQAYVPQVVVLHRSLREVLPGARLQVLCMEPWVRRSLEALALPGLVPVAIEELEARDPALRGVRAERTPGEYCWSAKPSLCLDILARDRETRWITYLDADMMFFSDPRVLLDELGGASIGIMRHRFAPRFRSRERWAGIYNTAWVSFANDARGLGALRWWRGRCLEWCQDRVEDGRYGDQAYLDDWPRRFPGVHVLEHPGAGLAPWTDNGGLSREADAITVDGRALVFFHYQSLRVYRPRRPLGPRSALQGAGIRLSWRVYRGYRIPARERELVWEPYLRRLARTVDEILPLEPGLASQLRPPGPRELAREAVRHAWMRAHDAAAALQRPGRPREHGSAARR